MSISQIFEAVCSQSLASPNSDLLCIQATCFLHLSTDHWPYDTSSRLKHLSLNLLKDLYQPYRLFTSLSNLHNSLLPSLLIYIYILINLAKSIKPIQPLPQMKICFAYVAFGPAVLLTGRFILTPSTQAMS